MRKSARTKFIAIAIGLVIGPVTSLVTVNAQVFSVPVMSSLFCKIVCILSDEQCLGQGVNVR